MIRSHHSFNPEVARVKGVKKEGVSEPSVCYCVLVWPCIHVLWFALSHVNP